MAQLAFFVMDTDEAEELRNHYFESGWNHDVMTDCLTAPSSKLYWIEDCLRILSGRPEFGNGEQLEALKALNYFNILANANMLEKETLECMGWD